MKRLILACILVTVSACASTGLSVKQTTVNAFQAANVFLTNAQTLERSYCFLNPITEAGTHCTNPLAGQIKLTDAIHVRMATFFNDAFGIEVAAGPALTAWQAGSPVPMTVAQYLSDITTLLSTVQTLDPAAAPLVSQVQQAANSGAAIATALGVK
jgi:hypothetical protein